jgi:integrase
LIAPNKSADPKVSSATLLREYLDDIQAVNQWRNGITAHEIHLNVIAVRWFDAFLKRAPTLQDLSNLTLSEKQSSSLQQFIVDNGRKPSVARASAERLFAIWRGIVWCGQLPSNGKRPKLPMGKIVKRRNQQPAANRIPTADRVAREKSLKPAAELRAPMVNATGETTLADLLYKHYAIARPISESTLRTTYSGAIRSFGLFLAAPAKVKDLTAANVNGWLVWASGRFAPHTLHGARQVILCLWRFAFEESIVHDFPRKIRKVKRPRLVVEAWDTEQVGKLLAAADATAGEFRKTGIEKRLWWRAFILVAWYTGLRLSDVLAIKGASIARMADGSGRLTTVMQKTQEAIHRIFPQDAMQAVDACMSSGTPRELILPPWVNRRFFYREFKLLVKAAGLTGSAKWLRRGGASEAERIKPGAGSLHLGHRSPGLFASNYKCDRIVQQEITLPPSPVLQAALRRDGATEKLRRKGGAA